MPRLTGNIGSGDQRAPFDAYYRGAVQVAEQAALVATDQARKVALRDLRSQMQGAGLGRLGNAIGSTSDLERGRGVFRTGTDGFSASGVLFVRSRSERSMGAIESYTEGSTIRPVRGRWLWIATDEIPRVTGRERMTPELYRRNGFEQKIGPLVLIRSINGNPLLVAKNISVSEVGKRRSAKSLTKGGAARKGQRGKEFVVAFIGIPRTTRAARIDASAVIQAVVDQLPQMWAQAMQRNAR